MTPLTRPQFFNSYCTVLPQYTLLYGARQLLTLRGPSEARRGPHLHELGIIENGSVLIENGRIYSLGSTRRIENLKESRNALTIDVTGCLIMPGLIDADFAVTYNGPRPNRRRPGCIYDDGLALARSCLQHGTLGAVLKVSGETDSFEDDSCLLRQFKKIGNNPVDTVRSWHIAKTPHDLRAFEQALETLVRRRLLDSIGISSHMAAHDTFSSWLARILATGLPTHLHWHEGASPLLRHLLDTLRPRAVSCGSLLTSMEVEVLSRSDAIGVFAPGSELGRSSGTVLRSMADAGGAIALSSGYHPVNSPGFSMQMAIALATVRGGLSAEEAIVAATVNSAYAAGCGATVGTIEKGRRANLLVLNIPDYREIPRQFGINQVVTVLKDGEVVLNRGGWKIGSHDAAAHRVRPQPV